MEEKKHTFGQSLLGLATLPLALMLRGLVISVVWEWFVVPLGVVPLSPPHALGLVMLSRLFISHLSKDKRDLTPFGENVVSALASVVLLGMSWAAYQFV